MPRRVSLPAADELFRTTGGSAVQPSAPQQGTAAQGGQVNGETAAPASSRTKPKVPAPSPEPAAETPGTERASSGGASDKPATGGEHEGRERRPAQDTERQAPPAQQSRTTAERSAARGGGTKSGRAAASSGTRRGRANRRPSGRERHDEKITVYVSAEELMDLEHARLVLRGEHGLAVDRGRIVREAVAVVLADLESRGDASILVRRLRGR